MSTDYLADPRFKLGSLCKRGHDYNGTGLSLRYAKDGGCRECAVAAVAARNHAKQGRPFTDEERRQRRDYKQRLRQRNIALGLTAAGHPPVTRRVPMTHLERAILNAGQCPSVATLVAREQARWVKANPLPPEEKARRAREAWRRAYQSNPSLRLYNREKAHRRRARIRGQRTRRLTTAALQARFAMFGNCCAYCGVSGDMQIEHVVPLSKGGAHDAMNIVPACQRCNYSKHVTEVEQWYRAQSFFSPSRLAMIKNFSSQRFSDQLTLWAA